MMQKLTAKYNRYLNSKMTPQSESSSLTSLSNFSFKEQSDEQYRLDIQRARTLDLPLFLVQRDACRVSPELVCKLSVNYNRKEKSLEWLSHKFLQQFSGSAQKLIRLDKLTEDLGVERRRIYDIINILESVKLVARKAKNCYIWRGMQMIEQAVAQIAAKPLSSLRTCDSMDQGRKGKSLEVLSVGFLNLLINCRKAVSLQTAAKALSSQNLDYHRLKTKIRRLYDIANVLKSLGLVRKSKLDNNKPGFQWICKGQAKQEELTSDRIFLICQKEYYPQLTEMTIKMEVETPDKVGKTVRRQFESTCSSFKKVQLQ